MNVATIGAVFVTAAALYAQTLPAGYTDSQVASIPSPTGIAFLPDNRMLVTSQNGTLRIVDTTASVVSIPALTIPANRICTNSERGLLGVAVDPDFVPNSYIYLYYTHRADGVSCGSRTLPMPMNRVSRFTMTGNTVDFASEVVLISNLPSWNGNHNGGDIKFGNDRLLYITVGDSGCDPYGNGCAGTNDAARDVNTLLGKVLRIRRNGDIPENNPWTGSGTQRCNETNAPAGVRCQETFAWGLRNPFRIAFNPSSSPVNPQMFILDVGQNAWEEINEAVPGADYGWNQREGACVNGSFTNCPPAAAGLTDPIYAYAHGRAVPGTSSTGCDSISGGAFVPREFGPPDLAGAFLFADYVCGSIFKLSRGVNGTWSATDLLRTSGGTVHLTFGRAGTGFGLYYTTYAGGGEIRRITYRSDLFNSPPSVQLGATPSAENPLRINFDASRSTDADGDELTYIWNFGDGTPEVSTPIPTVSHLYAEPGRYTVTLLVRDSRGAESRPLTLPLPVAVPPPSSTTILFPQPESRFRANDTVMLRANVPEGTQLTWDVVLQRGDQVFPYAKGTDAVFPMTTPGPASLAETESTLLGVVLGTWSSSRSVAFRPLLVPVTLNSDPPGRTIHVNGSTFTTPATFQSWADYPLYITAPDQDGFRFAEWAGGAARSHKIVTPAEAVTLTAKFSEQPSIARIRVVNAAGFQVGGIAPGSMATIQSLAGLSLGDAPFSQAQVSPWPAELGGIRVVIEGREGVEHAAALYVSAPELVTFEVPSQIAMGRAILRVWRGDSLLDQDSIEIETTSPGLFAASENGSGPARQTNAWIDGKQAFVSVLSTGLRNNPETVEVLVSGTPAATVRVTPTDFPGVDELTIGIPSNVYRANATATLIVGADGRPSNIVTVTMP